MNHPAEECPSEVDELFEVEVFAKLALCFYTLYEAEVVGTNIHFKLRDLDTCWIECSLEFCIKLFQIVGAFLL